MEEGDNTRLNLLRMPHNVLLGVYAQLSTSDAVKLARTCHLLFETLIPQVYSNIVYDINRLLRRHGGKMPTNDTIVNKSNFGRLLESLTFQSHLGFHYSGFVQRLYLADIEDPEDILKLQQWAQTPPHLPILQLFEFPESAEVAPLTADSAPHLRALYIDENFCQATEQNKGTVDFINVSHIDTIWFKPRLGRNEDVVLFNLLTTHRKLVKQLKSLMFTVDTTCFDRNSDSSSISSMCPENSADMVYRRLVGFFAILRRMGMALRNVSRLSLPLTNHSTPVIMTLVGAHVYFENVTDLELYIEDDGGKLRLSEAVGELASIISVHGSNIKHLSVNYRVLREDSEKNHLRALMLSKLFGSFNNLKKLNISLAIDGLDLSNLLMMLAMPISRNSSSLRDVRIDIGKPSDNLIGNLLPTLGDIERLLPSLNFLTVCSCETCSEVRQQTGHSESVKLSQLMMIGSELDRARENAPFYTMAHQRKRFLRKSDDGAGFDHVAHRQINEMVPLSVQTFELCGIVYFRNQSTNELERLYGPGDTKMPSLDQATIEDIVGMAQVLGQSIDEDQEMSDY